MTESRFKIDHNRDSSYRVFGLFYRRPTWLGKKWKLIDGFEKRDEAVALYEKIKDLPEYLP